MLYLVYADAEGMEENALVFAVVAVEHNEGRYTIATQSNLYSEGVVFEYKTKNDGVMSISIINSDKQSVNQATDISIDETYYYRCLF